MEILDPPQVKYYRPCTSGLVPTQLVAAFERLTKKKTAEKCEGRGKDTKRKENLPDVTARVNNLSMKAQDKRGDQLKAKRGILQNYKQTALRHSV